MTAQQIADLQGRVADLKARLPKHSATARMLIELEELEEELETALAAAAAAAEEESEARPASPTDRGADAP